MAACVKSLQRPSSECPCQRPRVTPGHSALLSTLPQSPDCSDSWGSLAEMDCQAGKETRLLCIGTHNFALPETQRRVTGTSQVLKVCTCLADVMGQMVERQG